MNREQLAFLWRDGHTVIQIALQLKCSAREVQEALPDIASVAEKQKALQDLYKPPSPTRGRPSENC